MLNEKAKSQQTALWELVETEVAYIRTLKVIQDVINLLILLLISTYYYICMYIVQTHYILTYLCTYLVVHIEH